MMRAIASSITIGDRKDVNFVDFGGMDILSAIAN